MRPVLTALLVAALAAPLVAGPPENPEIPRQGEELKKFDWDALYPPGDSWKEHEQVFVWNNDTEPETLDPALMTGVTEHNVAMALLEGLTTTHPATLQPIPGAAEWWEISKDGLVYTFHLRADGKWSNGDPVTAEDFRWSWERALTPATGCKYAEMYFPIVGAEAFNAGKAKWEDVGVAVTDPLTLRVTLHDPTPYFLELAAFDTLYPVHRATVTKHGDKWTQPGNHVGNGPFRLDDWKPKDRIECSPNPHWWNRKRMRLSKMVIRAIAEQGTSMSEYLAGGVDWIRSIPAARVEDAQAHPDYYVAPYLGSYFFRFNVTKKPFDDVRVRKAFTQAIDKRAICEKVLKAGQIPAEGVVPAGMIPGYPEFKGLAYDPKKARELFAEAGYPDGRGFPEVELLYNTLESHKQVCEQMVEMWKTTLGIKVTLANKEWQTYLKDTHSMQFQIARGAWIADYMDPGTFLDMWCTDRGNNNTGWSSAKYDGLLRAAEKENDLAKRYSLLAEAEQLVCATDVAILPLYYYVNQGMLRPRVKGWHENVRDLHPLQYVWIDGPPAKGK